MEFLLELLDHVCVVGSFVLALLTYLDNHR